MLAAIAALFAISTVTATAMAETSTVKVTKGQRTPAIGIADGGQFLTNKPGGYYMGFIAIGESFTRDTVSGATNNCSSPANRSSWMFRGRNCSDYLFGQAGGSCVWAGPKSTLNGLRKWWKVSGSSKAGRACTAYRRSQLHNPYNIGHRFNCWAGNARNKYKSAGTWPSGPVPLSSERLFYRNATWVVNPANKRQYLISNLTDYITTLPAGRIVQYRYSTLDDGFDVVYLGGYGWGFIQHGAIDPYVPEIRGHMASPGVTGAAGKSCRAGF